LDEAMTRPIPLDMLEWQIGRAIALVVYEHPAPAPVGKIAAREVLQAIEAAGWRLAPRDERGN
jgi:hypothetical protein